MRLVCILYFQPKNKDGKLPGQVHYENLCMKAVNQSIGEKKGDKCINSSLLAATCVEC